MLSLFRTNQAFAGLLLFGYALILWSPLFLFPVDPVTEGVGAGVLGKWLHGLVDGYPNLAILLSVFLVGIQGIQINTWATRHHLSRSVTQFPGLFVVLTAALVYHFHGFSAFHAANVFLLFALLSLGRLYKKEEPAVALFNAGAWLGMASLFRPEYLVFLLAVLAVIGILRRVEFRSVLQVVTGTGLVYFFLLVFGYVTGRMDLMLQDQLAGFGLPSFTDLATADLPGLIAIGLLVVSVILGFGSINLMLNIEGSKNTNVLAALLLCSILVVLVCDNVSVLNAQALVVPLGGLLGLGMVNAAPKRAEAVHIILFAAALIPLFIGW